jgi:DNA-binding transcriptional LysR family regulator
MGKLPDLEGLAIFAKVVELRSFARTAEELQLSKGTVSKAVSRLEEKLRARLFNRTSRQLALTHVGEQLAESAAAVLAHGAAAESEACSQNVRARGLVRLAAPMTFGVLHLAPLLPAFFRAYPEVSLDIHLSDEVVDIIGGGFDAAIRIGAMRDSSLLARKLCTMPLYLVAAPSYLEAHGRPKHPHELSGHVGFRYSYQLTKDVWRFRRKSGEVANIQPSGPLRVNNGYAMLPCLIAGLGLGLEPEFIVRAALDAGELEIVLPDWSLPASAVYWVTPPGGMRTKRIDILADYLASHFIRKKHG